MDRGRAPNGIGHLMILFFLILKEISDFISLCSRQFLHLSLSHGVYMLFHFLPPEYVCWLSHTRIACIVAISLKQPKHTEYRIQNRIQNTEYFIVTLIIHVMQAKVLQAIKYITTYNT